MSGHFWPWGFPNEEHQRVKNTHLLTAYIFQCDSTDWNDVCHERVMKPNSFACGHNARSRDPQERATGTLAASTTLAPGDSKRSSRPSDHYWRSHTAASGDGIWADCCIIHRLWMWPPRASVDDETAVKLNVGVRVFGWWIEKKSWTLLTSYPAQCGMQLYRAPPEEPCELSMCQRIVWMNNANAFMSCFTCSGFILN